MRPEDERQAEELAFDVFSRDCPSRTVLEHLTGRWGVLVMAGLRRGPARFNRLRRRIDGVSEKMLAQTLQALERDGFVTREVLAVLPPKVNYSLTPLGESTADHLLALIEHIHTGMPEVMAAREAHAAAGGGAPEARS
ncbi:helix-turn-helix domain-containing protein [Streptomyces sp. DSM 44915]|uniref:Helix-turn-helix domain-containing protein n=1 Tax=Streptomyces chisholmiae TaxID=3075540 RepID=A0ABU2JII4_9ACTN|nr:helix-turn-helix domain-containing protein [Streptomyces sp. DSM 44915]MDT0264797.1 helix-turn-helix domain-containing protein [Streptomyces sp. DSM 44915]